MGRRQVWLGCLFYVAVLAAGYYYNLTFVQLGIIDMGTAAVGLSPGQVSAFMAAFAVIALAAAVATGWRMDHLGWSRNLQTKLRVLFVVVSAQTLLTFLATTIGTTARFSVWILVCGLTLGVGMPVSFGLMADLVPVRQRGLVAATTAGLAFFAAALYPMRWSLEEFSAVMGGLMVPAVVVLGLLAHRSSDLVAGWSLQHERFGVGRFVAHRPIRTASLSFWLPVGLMFAVFFIDSVGFLRIVDTPIYIQASWQSPEVGVRVFIAVTHLVGAAVAGVLYSAFSKRLVFIWILGLFAFTHLLYTFHLATAPSGIEPPLVLPLFYVLAVSFYTTVNFAIWPDLSTPRNIGLRTGLGVGIAGWLASFLSTSVALYSRSIDLSLLDHLRYVNAFALLLAVALPVILYVRKMASLAAPRGSS